MNDKLLQHIRQVVPYTPGEQPQQQVIKLNTNENPYAPAPEVEEILRTTSVDKLRLYPDPTCKKLVTALANYHKVEPEQVFVGVGSDDVIAMCFLTFFNGEEPILFPDISYSFYEVWANLYRIPFICPALDAEFRINQEDYKVANGGIIFPNPNAPTAIYEELDMVEEILQANPDVVVIVDEAYIDFAGKSAIELIDKYENLIVVQTFSKSRSLAGMRIGYAISNPVLIGYLNAAKHSFNSYTLNQVSLACGVASVENKPYFRDQVAEIVRTREWAKEELQLLGFTFPDAQANFIFATHPKYDAQELFEALKKANIYVRYFNKERIRSYLRITIGTREEMEVLFAFLREYIAKQEG